MSLKEADDDWKAGGRIANTRSEITAVDARYEHGARSTALLTPKPPYFTGKETFVQAFSF